MVVPMMITVQIPLLSFYCMPAGMAENTEQNSAFIHCSSCTSQLIFLPALRQSFYCCSVVKPYPTLYYPMDCSMPGFPALHYLPEFLSLMSLESVMPSNHVILGRPLLLLPSVYPRIRVFSSEAALCIRGPKKALEFRDSSQQGHNSRKQMQVGKNQDTCDYGTVRGTPRILLGSV